MVHALTRRVLIVEELIRPMYNPPKKRHVCNPVTEPPMSLYRKHVTTAIVLWDITWIIKNKENILVHCIKVRRRAFTNFNARALKREHTYWRKRESMGSHIREKIWRALNEPAHAQNLTLCYLKFVYTFMCGQLGCWHKWLTSKHQA